MASGRDASPSLPAAAPPSPLRRADAVPLYHQIFLALRDEILRGRLAYGASVPTEHELAARHGVSRITARRALAELAAHKLVERRRRTGTRVVFQSLTLPIEGNVDQAVESLIAFSRATTVRVLAFAEERAAPEVAALLQRPADARVIRAQRLRCLDDEPLGQVTSYVPADLAIGLTRADLARAPMLDLLRAAGLALGGGRQTISAHPAEAPLAELLGIEQRAALLRIERVVLDAAQRPLLLTVADYRADRYRISLDLHGAPRVEAGPPA